jgi:hypothetical protein
MLSPLFVNEECKTTEEKKNKKKRNTCTAVRRKNSTFFFFFRADFTLIQTRGAAAGCYATVVRLKRTE